jgi:hypothetical protein
MEIPNKVEKAKLTFDGAVINVTINGAWQYLRAERQMALATCGLGAPRTREIAGRQRLHRAQRCGETAFGGLRPVELQYCM